MEPVAKEEVERIYELYHEKKYHEYIKAGLGLVEKGIISEFLFSTIANSHFVLEQYDLALLMSNKCNAFFPSTTHLINLAAIHDKLKSYDDQAEILIQLYETTHEVEFLNKLLTCPFQTKMDAFTNIIKWYREGLFPIETLFMCMSRFLFKNCMFFLQYGRTMADVCLGLLYNDDITDELVWKNLETAPFLWVQTFSIYYLIMPKLIYTSNQDIESEYNRLESNLKRLSEFPLKSMTVFDYSMQFSHNISYYYTYTGYNIKNLLQNYSIMMYKLCPDLNDYTAPIERLPNATPRIGILSRFVTENHSVCRDRAGIIKALCHDPTFEIYLIVYDEKEGDVFRSIMGDTRPYKKVIIGKNDIHDTVKTIRDLALDVLLYPEIGMCGFTSILAHTRLATTQAVTWGHSETSGIPTIDYYVSSKWYEDIDIGPDNYSEKLITMNSLSTYYYNLNILPECTTLNESLVGIKRNHRFYNTHRTYGIFQTMFKYHPDSIWIIKELLIRDPNGIVVVLLDNHPAWISHMEEQLGPLCSRLRMVDKMNKQNYCRMLRCMDILIDTYPFGGCNTTLDAFFYKKIVMTMPSSKLNGRFTYGFYQKMGITEPICLSLADLVLKTLYYASNDLERMRLEDRIHEKSVLLYEELDSITEWNSLFREWCLVKTPMCTPNIVLSRFKEDISYMENYLYPTLVYNKGDECISPKSPFIYKRIIKLPNIGKCDHTYLTHIISNYDILSDITLFLPASFYYQPNKRSLANQLIYRVMVTGKTCFVGKKLGDLKTELGEFKLESWDSTFKANKELSPQLELCEERPFGTWFSKLFGEQTCPFVTYFGILAVRKEDILRRPKSFYEELLNYVKTPNPEAGHYIERSWGVIFQAENPEYVTF
jgi:predicted O-linked N-acetylglucosamine transferase (SPINDLY family)